MKVSLDEAMRQAGALHVWDGRGEQHWLAWVRFRSGRSHLVEMCWHEPGEGWGYQSGWSLKASVRTDAHLANPKATVHTVCGNAFWLFPEGAADRVTVVTPGVSAAKCTSCEKSWRTRGFKQSIGHWRASQPTEP